MERISKLETIRDIVRGITGVVLDGEMDDAKFRRILISGFGRLDRFNFSKPVLHVFKPEEGETIQAQIETLLKTKSRFSVMFENASVHFILNPSIYGAVTAALPTHKTFACIYNVFGVPCMELIKSTQNLPLQMIEYAETDIGVRVECIAYLLSIAILDPLMFCPLIERIKDLAERMSLEVSQRMRIRVLERKVERLQEQLANGCREDTPEKRQREDNSLE